jgi:Tfp pilus assembly protein PilF
MNDQQLAQMLYDGAVAVQQGDYERARGLLLQVVEHDEENAQAWLWLSGAVDDIDDQQTALENVLALDPANAAAQRGLALIEQQRQGR